MASKQYLFFSIDVGSAIDKIYSGQMTRLKLALECFCLTLQQKLTNNPTHEFAFSIFGDNESDDGNNALLYPMQKPSLELVRKLKQMSQTLMDSRLPGGDIFSAIEHIILTSRQHIGNKKGVKRAFLFTCGHGKTAYREEDIKNIAANLQEDGIKLNVIPIGFMKTYSMFKNEMGNNQNYEAFEQKVNADLLMQLKRQSPENVQIFETEIAINLYNKFRVKDTNPVVLYKGYFQISPRLRIPVGTYKCIRKHRLQSLGKYDMSIPFNQNLEKEKEIINEISYICEGDESAATVDKENIINGYSYGTNTIPVNNIIAPSMKIYEEKNFQLLGFVNKSSIPRESFMGEVELVVPTNLGKLSDHEMVIAKKEFTALVNSMKSLEKYAIARYVPRNSKNGVNPRLVTLIPHITQQRVMMYLIDLPTVEDVREYPFNPLKKATENQVAVVKQMIDNMMLGGTREDGEEEDELKIESTFNPMRQYFYQSIFYRAVNENESAGLPELDPVIKDYITPERHTFDETAELMPDVKKEFKLVLKQLSKDKPEKSVNVMRWADMLSSTMKDTDQESNSSLGEVTGKKFNLEDTRGESFDELRPIQSFREMLTNNKKDLVSEAVKAMSDYIEKKCELLNTPQDLDSILDCAVKLREGCLEQKESQYWDDWYSSLEKKKPALQEKLKSKGHGFIDPKRNAEYYKKAAEEFKPASLLFDDDLD